MLSFLLHTLALPHDKRAAVLKPDTASVLSLYLDEGASPTCSSWCEGHSADWSFKCFWANGLCACSPQCDALAQKTGPRCEPWCESHSKPWANKCGWEPCSACSACTSPMTERVASLATMCTYSASNLAGLFTTGNLTAACDMTEAAGWSLDRKFSVVHGSSNDTDNAFFWRSGPDCLLTIHGMDQSEFMLKEFDYAAQSAPFRGVSAGFSQGLTDELEVFLDHITTEYGSLTAFGASCPGNLYLAGHSMGAGVAAVLGYMANLKSDPLALGKPVAGLYLFAAMPPATSQLTNEQSADGCFAGSNYYTRSLDGVVPGYPALADATFLDGSMAVAGYPDFGMVPAKTGFTSFDLAGPAPNVSNLLGPGVLTPCGDLPKIMTTMRNTTNWAKFQSYMMGALNPDPANIGYHEPFAYLWPADAVAMGA